MSREPFPIKYPYESLDVITTTPEASSLEGFLIPPILRFRTEFPLILKFAVKLIYELLKFDKLKYPHVLYIRGEPVVILI